MRPHDKSKLHFAQITAGSIVLGTCSLFVDLFPASLDSLMGYSLNSLKEVI